MEQHLDHLPLALFSLFLSLGTPGLGDGRGSIYVLIPPGDRPLGRKNAGGEADGGRRWKWEASNHRGEASVQNDGNEN